MTSRRSLYATQPSRRRLQNPQQFAINSWQQLDFCLTSRRAANSRVRQQQSDAVLAFYGIFFDLFAISFRTCSIFFDSSECSRSLYLTVLQVLCTRIDHRNCTSPFLIRKSYSFQLWLHCALLLDKFQFFLLVAHWDESQMELNVDFFNCHFLIRLWSYSTVKLLIQVCQMSYYIQMLNCKKMLVITTWSIEITHR